MNFRYCAAAAATFAAAFSLASCTSGEALNAKAANCVNSSSSAVTSDTTTSEIPTVTTVTAASTEAPASAAESVTEPGPAPAGFVAPEYIVGEGSVTLYNVAPIAEAYRTGDRSGLDETACAILDKAEEIIGSIITPDMSDYDKELAVHDYIVKNCTYDHGALAVIPHPSEHSDDPYGALINGQAICTGYTTAFRLFMDMLDIPCETVFSFDPMSSEYDHAWNIVTLEGSPYYVDVTWDDPIPDKDNRLTYHIFFNVSRYTLEYDHELSDICPETPDLKYAYASVELSPEPNSEEELTALAQSAIEKDNNSIIFIPSNDGIWKKNLSKKSDGSYAINSSELLSIVVDSLDAVNCKGKEILYCETDQGFALNLVFKRN